MSKMCYFLIILISSFTLLYALPLHLRILHHTTLHPLLKGQLRIPSPPIHFIYSISSKYSQNKIWWNHYRWPDSDGMDQFDSGYFGWSLPLQCWYCSEEQLTWPHPGYHLCLCLEVWIGHSWVGWLRNASLTGIWEYSRPIRCRLSSLPLVLFRMPSRSPHP